MRIPFLPAPGRPRRDLVSPALHAALDDPRTRYLIVDAWRLRKARESDP